MVDDRRRLRLDDDERMCHRWMKPLRRLWRPFNSEKGHSLGGVSGLKLLDIEGYALKVALGSVSREVTWLRWSEYPSRRNLPSRFPMDKLTVLELHQADLSGLCALVRSKCGGGFKQFPAQLRELNVTSEILRCPKSIGDLQHLEKVVFTANNMKTLPEEFCRLQSLKHMQLESCWCLEVLPTNFGDLTNLQHLALSGCYSLRTLPHSFGALIHLRYLQLVVCRRLNIPRDFLGNISTLQCIEIVNLDDGIEVLPNQITQQTFLYRMTIFSSNLNQLPENIGNLTALKYLKLGGCFTQLPPSIWKITNLTTLSLQYCRGLKYLTSHECSVNDTRSSGLDHFRGGVQQLQNLECLEICYCPVRDVKPFTSIIRTVDEEESMVGLTGAGGLLPRLHTLILQEPDIRMIAPAGAFQLC